MSDIDPISRDVFQHQVHGIAEEMSMALRRAAFSSIIWDMYDYSCGLFSPEGEMLSQAETIPAQLGIMSTAIRYMFAKIPRDQWKPGDIIVCNDPYQGCTHTPDVCLFSPVFHDGELIALTSTIAHHVDIGGKVPGSEGPDNMEVFAEGLILPPLKLIEEGRPNQAIFDILAANVRDPRGSAGDLRAQIAGCRTGERRLAELAGRYGNARFREMCNACLAYNETYMRRAIAALGDGRWEAEVFMEDDVTSKEPMRLHAVVTVAGEEITIDVSGSEPQRANGMNCPEASTLSMIHYAVKCVLAPDLPQNQGCDRPVHVVTKKGTLLDPIPRPRRRPAHRQRDQPGAGLPDRQRLCPGRRPLDRARHVPRRQPPPAPRQGRALALDPRHDRGGHHRQGALGPAGPVPRCRDGQLSLVARRHLRHQPRPACDRSGSPGGSLRQGLCRCRRTGRHAQRGGDGGLI